MHSGNEDKIDKLIEQLGDDKYQTREKATQELIKMGKDALPKLIKAYKEHVDLEVVIRADSIIWSNYTCKVLGKEMNVRELLNSVKRSPYTSKAAIQALSKCAEGIGDPLLEFEFGKQVRDALSHLSEKGDFTIVRTAMEELANLTIFLGKAERAKELVFERLKTEPKKQKQKEIVNLIEKFRGSISRPREIVSKKLLVIGRPALKKLREALRDEKMDQNRWLFEGLIQSIDFLPKEIETFLTKAKDKRQTSYREWRRTLAMDILADLSKIADAKLKDKIKSELDKIWKDPKEKSEDVKMGALIGLVKIYINELLDATGHAVEQAIDYLLPLLQIARVGINFNDEARNRALAELEFLHDREEVFEGDISYTISAMEALRIDADP